MCVSLPNAFERRDQMHARLSRFAGLPPARVDETLQGFRDVELPVIQRCDGFRGVVVMVNRATGQAASITYWETETDMRESEHVAGQAVQAAVTRSGPSREPVVDRYEVVLQG
jgi:heme-degrading monooxygenase HmoA